MNQEQFSKISSISDKGATFLEETLACFCNQLSDFEYDQLRHSLLTLVHHERMDAAVNAMEYYQKTYH